MVTLDLSQMGVKPPPNGQSLAKPNDNNPSSPSKADTPEGGKGQDTITGSQGTDGDNKAPAGYKAASFTATKEVTVQCTYLYSVRPDLGAFITDTKRAKFDGNYLKTEDKEVKDFLLEHYADYVKEISEEAYIDAHTLKQDK
jgi:hypothetical protein